MANENNPWKGVVPYSDDPEDLKKHPFRGRDKEIRELLHTINENEITTLYGRSGIGKTSLIKAGLFPKLGQFDFYPVYIRLYNEIGTNTSINFSDYIVNHLIDIARNRVRGEQGNECPPACGDDASKDDSTYDAFLWDFFSNHEFYHEGKEVIPVIVLDQFEEILRHRPKESITLLRQLRDAKNERYRSDGSLFEVNFRFVISIREDDLFLLEDAIDIHYIDKMKTGRYRLQPIDKETAMNEIVFIRDGLFDKDKDEIAKKLIKLSDQEGSVSSLLLSLVCRMAYKKSSNGVISLDVINALGDKPLISFYKESTAGMSPDFLDYFEDNFVEDTRRRVVTEGEIPGKYLGDVKKLAEENSEYHLLTNPSEKGARGRAYELLHDKLAEAISNYHAERLAELENLNRKRRIRKWLWIAVACLAVIALAIVTIKIANKPINYDFRGDYGGDTIPIYSRGYLCKDSVLCLTNCCIDDYTFYGNKEVRRVELDSVETRKSSVFLPNADTMVIGPRQWSIGINETSFPSVTTVIAKRPCSGVVYSTKMQHLDTAIVDDEDSEYVRWDNVTKTLFARMDTNQKWEAYLFRYSDVYVSDAYISDTNVRHCYGRIVDYDMANPPEKTPGGSRVYYRLVNSDTSKHTILAGEVPYNTKLISLRNIDTIGENAFSGLSVLNAEFEGVRYIGKRAFTGYHTADRRLVLPSVVSIADSAFMNTEFDTIVLESVLYIGVSAFSSSSWCNKAKRIVLPAVDEIKDSAFNNRVNETTSLHYKSNAKLGKGVPLYGKNTSNISVGQLSNSDVPKSKGYHIDGDTLIIDSSRIEKLSIEANIVNIRMRENLSEFSVEKITCSFKNRRYFTSGGNLYIRSGDSEWEFLVARPDRKKHVSLPQNVKMTDALPFSIRKCDEYVCLNRSDIARLSNRENIDLYVPYGQLEVYQPYNSMFNSIKELSWVSTIWYKTLYSTVRSVGDLHFMGYSVSLSDIFAFFSCFVLMVVSLVVAARFKWRRFRWWDVISLLVIIIAVEILLSPDVLPFKMYETSDGEHFHSLRSMFEHLKSSEAVYRYSYNTMWPVLLIALPLWGIYLYVTQKKIKRHKFNREIKH